MSWGTCYKGSNNIHAGFPALMSDGVWATNWEPACSINNALQKRMGITSNYNYRQFLIKNADAVIKGNQMSACDNCCACWENFEAPNTNTNTSKYIYKSCTDKTVPYGYEGSDLKNIYLSSVALQGRLKAPILTQSQMLSMPNFN